MKKLLQIATVAVFAVFALGITSCVQNTEEDKAQEPRIIDFRNKTSDGELVARKASGDNNDVTFKAEYLPALKDFTEKGNTGASYLRYKEKVFSPNMGTYEALTEEEKESYTEEEFNALKAKYDALKEGIVLSDDKDGVKLEITVPADFENITGWAMVYIDGKGNLSTSVIKDDAISEDAHKVTVVYPLVIPGREAKFWLQVYSHPWGEPENWYTEFFYSVMPAHGLACVDDLPDNYKNNDYSKLLKGKKIQLSKIVPPAAKNLTHTIQVNEKMANSYGWKDSTQTTFNTIGTVIEKASEEEIAACTKPSGDIIPFDLSKYSVGHPKEEYDAGTSNYYGGLGYDPEANNYKNMPYMFAAFSWSYTLDKFPGYTFSTPSLLTPTIENTDFRK